MNDGPMSEDYSMPQAPKVSSQERSDRFFGWHTIFGVEGEHETPYLTRIWFGRLRLHIFHRGDADPDCHDHPWDFWTFPLTSYVEEVAHREWLTGYPHPEYDLRRQVVHAFRLHYREATYAHRVLGRWRGVYQSRTTKFRIFTDQAPAPNWDPAFSPGKIVTLVWMGSNRRKWGFLKNRDGQWCWIPWKRYVFEGGKHAPCE